MPKGVKTIDWTAENDAKLLLTIIAIENVSPNYEKVAAAFGSGINATAIKNRMAKLRMKANSAGLVTGEGNDGNGGNDDGAEPATPPTKKQNGKGANNKVLSGKVTKAKAATNGKASKKQSKVAKFEEPEDDSGAVENGDGEDMKFEEEIAEGVDMNLEEGAGVEGTVQDDGESI